MDVIKWQLNHWLIRSSLFRSPSLFLIFVYFSSFNFLLFFHSLQFSMSTDLWRVLYLCYAVYRWCSKARSCKCGCSLILYTLTLVCTFSILLPRHFLKCWKGEFVLTIRGFFSWSFPLFSWSQMNDSAVQLSGETRCWPLFGLKGLTHTLKR